MEQAEVAAVLSDGLDWSKPFQVYHLNASQQKTDPLLQPVCLLLQAAIDGQLLKQLQPDERGGQKTPSSLRVPPQGETLQYFGPLVMDVHGSQHDVSRGVHSRLVSKHNSVSCTHKSTTLVFCLSKAAEQHRLPSCQKDRPLHVVYYFTDKMITFFHHTLQNKKTKNP